MGSNCIYNLRPCRPKKAEKSYDFGVFTPILCFLYSLNNIWLETLHQQGNQFYNKSTPVGAAFIQNVRVLEFSLLGTFYMTTQ